MSLHKIDPMSSSRVEGLILSYLMSMRVITKVIFMKFPFDFSLFSIEWMMKHVFMKTGDITNTISSTFIHMWSSFSLHFHFLCGTCTIENIYLSSISVANYETLRRQCEAFCGFSISLANKSNLFIVAILFACPEFFSSSFNYPSSTSFFSFFMVEWHISRTYRVFLRLQNFIHHDIATFCSNNAENTKKKKIFPFSPEKLKMRNHPNADSFWVSFWIFSKTTIS